MTTADNIEITPGMTLYGSDGLTYTATGDGRAATDSGWGVPLERPGWLWFFADRINCLEYRMKQLEDRMDEATRSRD